jgi:DNA gyrase subunit B
LTPGVAFTFIDEKEWTKNRFFYEWWLKTWLNNLVWNQQRLSTPQYMNVEWNDCLVEIAFQFTNSSNDNTLSFVNNIPTRDWWTHVLWFKSALLNAMNEIW